MSLTTSTNSLRIRLGKNDLNYVGTL